MLLLMPMMLMLMDNGWILLGMQETCLLLPISNQFPTSDDVLNLCVVLHLCCAVLSILLMEEIPNNHLLDVFETL